MDGRTSSGPFEAGAKFIASPGIERRDGSRPAIAHGVVSVVGAITPTEIMEALRLTPT